MSELGFHFDDSGEAGLPAVVFLHAFPLNGGMWAAQAQALAGRARRLSFDVRGFGRSPLSPTPFLFEHLVDDLLALLDARGIERALLVGSSMGGYVALRAAERAPERVAGLLLAGTQAAADANAAKLKRAGGVRQLLAGGVDAYVEDFLKGALSPETHRGRAPVVGEARRIIGESSPSALVHGLVALATRTDTTEALPSFAAPTRVVVGADDGITPPAVAEKLARAIPGADLHVLPGAGHLVSLELPERFNELLTELVDRAFGAPLDR